jgi:hypothetical protein
MQLLFEQTFSSFQSLALLLSSASPCFRSLLVASLQPDPWVLAMVFPPWLLELGPVASLQPDPWVLAMVFPPWLLELGPVASLQPDPWVLAMVFPPWLLELVLALAFQQLAEGPSKQPTQ